MAQAVIVVYDELNQTGSKLEITRSVADLRDHGMRGFLKEGNWNDEIKSWHVISGSWQMFENINFDSPYPPILKKGDKGNSVDWDIPFDKISSIQMISE